MAGFGNGFGFNGTPFPTRQGNQPKSSWVQSDSEFNDAWAQKLYATPRYIGGAVEMDPSKPGFDHGAAQGYYDSQKPAYTSGAPYQAPIGSGPEFDQFRQLNAQPGFYVAQPGPGPEFDQVRNIDQNTTAYSSANAMLNPEFDRIVEQMAQAGKQRTEAQTRNQQAYNTTMMGGGSIGGVMPPDYSSPTYGQVTGQKQGGLGGLGGFAGGDTGDLTGIGADPQSGAYTGGAGAYNPNPFAPGNFQKSPWDGF